MNHLPLTLYIHFPWCLRKCPYCDFNSREVDGNIPEADYIDALIRDLKQDLPLAQNRPLKSIFIGGGTPSLLSAVAIKKLLYFIQQAFPLDNNIEITLELNPGTSTKEKLREFQAAGINRLSIGVQSFQDNHLKSLDRIHDSTLAKQTIIDAKDAGFKNINIDLMHGLPNQTIDEALLDLKTATKLAPQHISWYELTIEPDTYFGSHPPHLPEEKTLHDIQQGGHDFLTQHGFNHYEISGYSLPDFQCQHNLNYWEFGDYLGIGPGAHGKITKKNHATFEIARVEKNVNPEEYLKGHFINSREIVKKDDISLEFMLNALRLTNGFEISLFEARTGIKCEQIESPLQKAQEKGFLIITNNKIKPTKQGLRFLNECLALF